MKNIRATDPRAYGACWTDGQIASALAGRASVSVVDLCTASNVGDVDKIWLLCAHAARVDRPALITFARWCAARYAAAAADAAADADAADDAAADAYYAARRVQVEWWLSYAVQRQDA